jgi:hypothetical protein
MWLSLLLVACKAPDPIPDEVAVAEDVEISAQFDTRLVNVLHVDITSPDAVEASVRWGTDPENLHRQTPISGAATTHRLDLVGLAQEQPVHWQVLLGAGESQTSLAVRTEDTPAVGLPDLNILMHDVDRSELGDGWVFASLVSETASGVVAWDAQGRVGWGWQTDAADTLAWPAGTDQPDELMVMVVARDRMVDDTRVHRIPMNGDPVTITQAHTGHHGFVLLPDGDMAWLGLTFGVQDVSAIGLTEPPWTLMADTVWRGPEGGGADDGTVLFDYLTDWPHPFFLPCTHPLTQEDRLGQIGIHEWTHANSIAYVPGWDVLLMGTRLHDSIVALDPQTGEYLWEAGGQSGFSIDDPWSHGHFSHAWEGGMLMFDNGSHHPQQATRLVELAIDPVTSTTEVVWAWQQPYNGFTSFLGDARRLPGGHILGAFTELGLLVEIDPTDGAVVWQAQVPGYFIGRVRHTESLYEIPPG